MEPGLSILAYKTRTSVDEEERQLKTESIYLHADQDPVDFDALVHRHGGNRKMGKNPLVPVNLVGRRRGWSVADMANDYHQ